jgi:hypothetical protein
VPSYSSVVPTGLKEEFCPQNDSAAIEVPQPAKLNLKMFRKVSLDQAAPL